MEKLDKYVKLILDKCLSFESSKSLFISYEKALNEEFVSLIVSDAKKRGIDDIYLYDEASFLKHDFLLKCDIDDINNNSLFECGIWDEYAKKTASFLIIKTEIPGLFDDVDFQKIALARKRERSTRQVFLDKQMIDEVSWCIIAYPNKYWANDIFKNDENAYEKLHDLILDACMCNLANPSQAWDEYLSVLNKRCEVLNNLQIEYLHYTNSLGTDLFVYFSHSPIWRNACSKYNVMVNMPSYEVFTTPDTNKTTGIVYNSKPLLYNGIVVDGFYLKFENGKVVDYDAKKGKNALKSILEYDDYSNMLGEAALVDYDSFISNTNVIFKTTLFDENASCHLALGAGFMECISDYEKKKDDNVGLNKSKLHVDFMIGTKDLKIVAKTKNGEIIVFENGNFVI